jgi:hypothetical protein
VSRLTLAGRSAVGRGACAVFVMRDPARDRQRNGRLLAGVRRPAPHLTCAKPVRSSGRHSVVQRPCPADNDVGCHVPFPDPSTGGRSPPFPSMLNRSTNIASPWTIFCSCPKLLGTLAHGPKARPTRVLLACARSPRRRRETRPLLDPGTHAATPVGPC